MDFGKRLWGEYDSVRKYLFSISLFSFHLHSEFCIVRSASILSADSKKENAHRCVALKKVRKEWVCLLVRVTCRTESTQCQHGFADMSTVIWIWFYVLQFLCSLTMATTTFFLPFFAFSKRIWIVSVSVTCDFACISIENNWLHFQLSIRNLWNCPLSQLAKAHESHAAQKIRTDNSFLFIRLFPITESLHRMSSGIFGCIVFPPLFLSMHFTSLFHCRCSHIGSNKKGALQMHAKCLKNYIFERRQSIVLYSFESCWANSCHSVTSCD